MRHPRVWLNASCTPGRSPEQPPPATEGPPLGRAPLRTRKREKPRGASTGAYYQVQRLLGAPHPSLWGKGKRDGLSSARAKRRTCRALAILAVGCLTIE